MIATLVVVLTLDLTLAICFGGSYLMNPKSETEYSYKPEELWEKPAYWS